MAELVELSTSSGIPSYMVDELIVSRIDAARERAKYERAQLVHVRERRVVDESTGEVAYEFVDVLGVVVRTGGRVPVTTSGLTSNRPIGKLGPMGLSDRDYMKRQARRDRVDRLYETSRSHLDTPRGTTSLFGARRRRKMSSTYLVVCVFLSVFGLVVLPYFVVAGHHWRFFVL